MSAFPFMFLHKDVKKNERKWNKQFLTIESWL